MLILQAHWFRASLYLWGTQSAPPQSPSSATDRGEPVSAADLRARLGDRCDSLLISPAEDALLSLRLPCVPGDSSSSLPVILLTTSYDVSVQWRVTDLSALRFAPDEAYDLLQHLPVAGDDSLRLADSARYWVKLAQFARELLAAQHFAPALRRVASNGARGYWRVILPPGETTHRLDRLVAAMPPVCRSFADAHPVVEAAELVESFLGSTVDALVRRCLVDDPLVHALVQADASASPHLHWLRSLVGVDSVIAAGGEATRTLEQTLHEWLRPLDPRQSAGGCRTAIRLNAPDSDEETTERLLTLPWTLTFELHAADNPAYVLDARELFHESARDPAILPRPFDGAEAQLRADLSAAARHFPPLALCGQPDGPLVCELSLEEAYRFLREAAPLLEAEGIIVRTPPWWRDEKPRLRMVLDLRPPSGEGTTTDALRLDALVEYDWNVALGDDHLSIEDISRLAQTKLPLVRLRGRWIEPRTGDLAAALQFLQQSRRGRTSLLNALRMVGTADDLNTGLPVGDLRASGWVDRLLNFSEVNNRVEALAAPRQFRGALRPYQLRGVEWLRFLTRHGMGGCLADDMGLGKTIQLIGLLLTERESADSPGPTLLVVPMSLVGNWQRELARFAPALRVLVHHGLDRLSGESLAAQAAAHDVVIVTYGLTHRDFDDLARIRWHRVALDEAQNIKNPAAKQSVAIRALHAEHRVALTGTPVENRLSELWSIMDFLNPGYLGSAADFRRRFAGPIERQRDVDRTQRLRHLIRPFVLRRLKSDPRVLPDLPAKLDMTVYCNLTREQAALYEALVRDMLSQIESADGIQRRGLILAALVKLKQICNHPAHFLADGSPVAQRSGKVERLCDMLEEIIAEGDRALVFTQFRRMGHLLQPHLHQVLGAEVLFLHGGVPQPARSLMVERFQSGKEPLPVMILSLKAGGLGLNLTAASHVFHFDRWWNPAVEDQATDRAHRIGQSRQVQVHKFVCVGTLEERIAAMIDNKRILAQQIIGSGEEWITELSTDALRELFALSRDAVGE